MERSMTFCVVLTGDTGGLPPEWTEFFQAHQDLARVEWEYDWDGVSDITVYFRDSQQPFPVSSLRSDSQLKQDLYALAGWYNSTAAHGQREGIVRKLVAVLEEAGAKARVVEKAASALREALKENEE